MNYTLLTLAIPYCDEHVLLGMKKRGFGADRWNGFGGKIEYNETIEGAAHRELEEEAGISPVAMDRAGVLEFSFPGDIIYVVHVFRVDTYEGVPQETEEMRPAWFAKDAVPFEEMWEDDVHWFPYFLERTPFTGHACFDMNERMQDHQIVPHTSS